MPADTTKIHRGTHRPGFLVDRATPELVGSVRHTYDHRLGLAEYASPIAEISGRA